MSWEEKKTDLGGDVGSYSGSTTSLEPLLPTAVPLTSWRAAHLAGNNKAIMASSFVIHHFCHHHLPLLLLSALSC